MKRFLKGSLSMLLAFLMIFQMCGESVALAAEEIDKALNPAEQIELTVPERFRDGGNWFFIPEQGYSASEKSEEKIYIPIQRTGDLETEADVVLKVSDISARHDVNYQVEIYKEDVDPAILLDDQSLVDIIQNADGQEEYEPIADENEFGELVNATGGAEIVDADGNVMGTVSATRLDENGNPIEENENADAETPAESEEAEPEKDTETPADEAETVTSGEVDETEWTNGNLSGPESLLRARQAVTGTVSDRQELEGGNLADFNAASLTSTMSEGEFDQEMADIATEDYPGKEYTLRYSAGEEAKFLVITPLYSEAAEGDAQIMLLLKNPSEGFAIGEDVNPVSITIFDEDEPEPVTVSMAAETVTAENGKAAITVTRQGRINAIKGVTLSSWDGSAKEGDEYSGIGAKLYFPVGITSRTVEIPVYHGEEEKDFYVSINALDDENIALATTHVVIPAAEAESDGELMADDNKVDGRPYGDAINIKGGWLDQGEIKSDNAFKLTTTVNKKETSHFWLPTAKYGYAYDGLYLDYTAWTSWCDIECRLVRWINDSPVRLHTNSWKNDKEGGNHWLAALWGSEAAPEKYSIEIADVNKKGPAGTKSYCDMHVSGVHLIKRKFTVYVEDPEVKPLIGVSDEDVLRNYEAVFLDGKQTRTRDLWTDDAFSVCIKNEKGPLRLVGLEALSSDGKWIRIVTIDGKSQLANVTLNADTVNSLAAKNCVTWSTNGALSVNNGNTSYKGAITVRPVFDYNYATVELKDDANGSLSISNPTPSILWDFNRDGAMSQYMGKFWNHQVSYEGVYDGYAQQCYKFTAGGNDPYVSIDNSHAESVDNIQWVKIRARTDSSAAKMQLFAALNNNMPNGNSTTDIALTADDKWHEYIINIPEANKATQKLSETAWQGNISWIRLDPLEGCKNGDIIYIDYVAFFPDEASARAFRNSSSTDGTYTSTPGTYTYHLGDRVSFQTSVSDLGNRNNLKADGVSYELRKFGETGKMTDWIDVHYINNTTTVALSGKTIGDATVDQPHYSVKPTFTEKGNCVTVEVSKAALGYLDTTKGIFASGNYVSRAESGSSWIYTIQEDVLSNVPVELTAYPKNANDAMVCWIMSSGAQYWSNSAVFRTGERTAANQVKLQVFAMSENSLLSDDGDGVLMDLPAGFGPTYASISGTVVTSTFNLSTERSAVDKLPARSAYVACGDSGTWTQDDGSFELPAIFTMGGGMVSYTVTYNGATSIHTVKIPGPSSPKSEKTTMQLQEVQAVSANAGLVQVEAFSETGAHFVSAYAEQDNILKGTVNGLIMNGLTMTIEVQVAQGEDYILNGRTYSEDIKDVTLYFQDQTTGEIHGSYSSNATPSTTSPAQWSYNKSTGIFTLTISQFDPAHPTDWTYGDVLMAQLTTNKKAGISAFDEKIAMVYEPISTGIAVYADPDYEPQTFDFDLDNIAELLQISPQTDKDGKLLDDDNTRYSFGNFPYIGEITAAVHVFSKLVASAATTSQMDLMMADLTVMAGDGDGEDDDIPGSNTYTPSSSSSAYQNYTLNVLIKIDQTVYGGVRFMFGVIISGGGGNGYQRQRNPFQNVNNMIAAYQTPPGTVAVEATAEIINYVRQPAKPMGDKSQYRNNFGGPSFTFGAFVGFYLDYGYIEISEDNGAKKSHDMVFMGAGGFIGFNGTIGYTFAFNTVIPWYINVEAGLNVTFFLGSEGNPQKTLQSFKTDKELHGQDFSFNFEFKGRAYFTGTIGVGFYKILGVRVSVTLAFEAGYGNNITTWYPNLFDSGWGYVTEATFTGTIDLIVTSIDFYSATWPLPLHDGFMYYFQETRRANKCISYVEKAIQKKEGSASARATAQAMCNELKKLVDTNELLAAASAEEKPNLADVETIKNKTYALKDYAYKNKIINWTTKNTIEMNKQGGIVGAIVNAATEDDEGDGLQYHTNDHVDSQWVANDGELMAAYGNASSRAIMTDAYAQPSSKIISIGGGKYLMAFLGDTENRDRMAASTLMWSVYDEADNSCTTFQAVAGDRVADSRPNLVDAGNKVILSWAGIPVEKYNDIKNAFKTELQGKTGAEPTDAQIQKAMEDDPARVMSGYEIYSVEFDKSSQTLGTIERLTNDNYYDDYPQAVYDNDTKDYIVLYYKTAQDDAKYDEAGDKLQDLIAVSPDRDKTYSIICYMLYNATEDADAGYKDDTGTKYTVPAGWVREYLYDNEFNADEMRNYPNNPTVTVKTGMAGYLQDLGGQRILPSTLRNADGTYTDPPITDLTVAPGRNGIATYAFTVDKDFNLKTAGDRELYVEFYNFETHGTYVPVKVGGEITVESEKYDANSKSFVTVSSTKQVEVGTPKLIRNGGDTYLFWREDGDSLRYLNITEMLNAQVAAVANPSDNTESHWTYAVKDDGTFATDAATGKKYEPRVEKVAIASTLTGEAIEITDYEVINDKDGNLYVVWTDAVTTDVTNDAGETYPVVAQEIFASAMIRQEPVEQAVTYKAGSMFIQADDSVIISDSDTSGTETSQTVRWSKPYRLTRDNAFNDGLAIALDSEGGLIIVHNQYTKKMAESDLQLYQLISEGKIGVTQDKDGQLYAASLTYNSPVNLMVTRLDKVGSLEATEFTFSDGTPVAGETIQVSAAIENVGLTDAEGCQIEFYENKNGSRGRKIGETVTYNDTIQVNSAREVDFLWTVPADGPEGYSIEAVIKEKNGASYYKALSSRSDTFVASPYYRVSATDVTQEGDKFRVQFNASNVGNKAAEEGTTVSVRLVGLYGDLSSDRYGNLDTNVLYSSDITEKLKAKTVQKKTEMDKYALVQPSEYQGDVLVDIPVSVFRYCGYDAIQIVLTDKAGNILAESDQKFVTLDAPMNLSLNDGKAVSLNAGGEKQVGLDFDTNVFLEKGSVVYSVDDPTIATVDADGKLMGVGKGTTILRATLLPSGREESVRVTVGGGSATGPSTPGTPSDTEITVEVSSDEGAVSVTASVSGDTATITAPTNAQMEEITGKSKETGEVTIDLSSLPETVTAAVLPAETVKAIDEAMEDSGDGLTIKLPGSTVTFDPVALESITGQMTGPDLELKVDPITENSLNTQQKAAISELDVQAVYDIYLVSNGKRISDFGGGRAAVQVDHPMNSDQKPGGFTVWYVAEDGGKTHIVSSSAADTVSFTATHFSDYVVAYDETLPSACDRGEDCPMTAFTDLDKSKWYHDGVHWALEEGVMSGYGGGKFGPNDATTRAQIVQMLWNLEGRPTTNSAMTFKDVPAGKWYTNAVRWAAANKIVSGYSTEKFGPEDKLTREQLASILQRYVNYKGADTSTGEMKPLEGFDDAKDISGWAVKSFRWAVDAGIIYGTGNGKISPKREADRAQVATMLMRYDNQIAEQ